MKSDNYIGREQQFLKFFDKSMARSSQALIHRFGKEQAGSVINEARIEFEALIPQIPFIGHRTPLLVFLLATGKYLAIYRVLQKMGFNIEQAGQVIDRMNEAELDTVPMILRRISGYLWFSPLLLWRMRKRAKESQKRQYPDGYVFNFVEGDGQTFDYGLDYIECAGCKFLKQQGAPELAPFMCDLDKASSEILGWGLIRTMTIAKGYEKCDFRFKKGGKTSMTA